MTTTNAIPPSLASQAVNQATSAATQLQPNEQISQNQFLTLFVTQLQNQDPLSPMEPNDLTAQLAQFSSLEQLTGINDRLDKLVGKQTDATKSPITDPMSLLGRAVDFDASRLTVAGGKSAPIDFVLNHDVSNAVATVSDGDGNVVRRVILGDLKAGDQHFTFDGKGDDGKAVADGTYKVDVSAVPVGGTTALAVPLITRATVDGVDLTSNPPVLFIGDRRLTLDQVRGVHLVNTNS